MCILCIKDCLLLSNKIKSTTKLKICTNCNNFEYLKYFTKLIFLDCSFTKIKEIPKELVNLKKLFCICSSNIKYIPDTLINLEELYCQNTNINHLSNKFKNLKELDCSNTKVSKLYDSFNNLTYLYCYNTKIKEIPDIFKKLKILSCSNTDIQIINLDNLKLIKHNNPNLIMSNNIKQFYL